MAEESGCLKVCVRARPLNDRERDEGFRSCVSFDDATRQVVLSAVDKATLVQLRGQTAKGYGFDRFYSPEQTSDSIYDDAVAPLVENLFKGYNATVLAYGQTGSGKTLTMSGGTGTLGLPEKGIIRRAVEQIIGHAAALRTRLKPGEAVSMRAQALELYNEELRDLSGGRGAAGASGAEPPCPSSSSGDGGGSSSSNVRIAERPCGATGRCTPEVVGVSSVEVSDAESLLAFFSECFDNRAVCATRMNDRSSRSHAIYTLCLSRTLVDVSEDGGKVRTSVVESRLHFVDLAGSERVKRSGVTGAAFKEAVAINGGLLALGNVIVALSSGDAAAAGEAAGDQPGDAGAGAAAGASGGSSLPLSDGSASGGRASPTKTHQARHIPYRDSKLTRLLQDSLGGNALTVLISCVSSCEADFEETNSTLKYANRACRIRNQPLANKQLLLEEDLLPLLPAGGAADGGGGGGGLSMTQVQLLLGEHARMREARERREAERRDKEEKRLAELRSLKEVERKTPGFQRLRMAQYDGLRKKLISSHGSKALRGEVISDDTLAGFRTFEEAGGGPTTGGGDEWVSCASADGGGSGVTARTFSSCSSSQAVGRPRTAGSTSSSPVPPGSGSSASGSSPGRGSRSSSAVAAARGAVSVSRAGSPQLASIYGAAGSSNSGSSRQQSSTRAAAGVEQQGACPAAAEPAGVAARTTTSSSSRSDVPAKAGLDGSSIQGSMQGLKISAAKVGGAVDEVITGPSSPCIKACYAPTTLDAAVDGAAAPPVAAGEAAAAGQAAAGGQAPGQAVTSSSSSTGAAAHPPGAAGGRKSVGGAAAFDVLEFQPQQPQPAPPEPPPAAAAALQPAPPPPPPPQLLARFRVNTSDTLAVFRAVSPEDLSDVAALLPPNTALPGADRMTYLLARLEARAMTAQQLEVALQGVADGMVGASMTAAVGPAVGCLMATFGTSLITDCIFDFEDPEQLRGVGQEQRLELWGLQIPHHSALRPALTAELPAGAVPQQPSQPSQQQQQPPQQEEGAVTCWSSTDRLNVSIGLMYALCTLAAELGAVAGFCVPRPQLLRRWLQAGVRMRQVSTPAKLIYPQSAHDYGYYKASTVAFFLVDDVAESLAKILARPAAPSS